MLCAFQETSPSHWTRISLYLHTFLIMFGYWSSDQKCYIFKHLFQTRSKPECCFYYHCLLVGSDERQQQAAAISLESPKRVLCVWWKLFKVIATVVIATIAIAPIATTILQPQKVVVTSSQEEIDTIRRDSFFSIIRNVGVIKGQVVRWWSSMLQVTLSLVLHSQKKQASYTLCVDFLLRVGRQESIIVFNELTKISTFESNCVLSCQIIFVVLSIAEGQKMKLSHSMRSS